MKTQIEEKTKLEFRKQKRHSFGKTYKSLEEFKKAQRLCVR